MEGGRSGRSGRRPQGRGRSDSQIRRSWKRRSHRSAEKRAEALIVPCDVFTFMHARSLASSCRDASAAGDLRVPGIRDGGRSHVLRSRPGRNVATAPPSTSTRFSRARSPPTCPSSSPRSSSWSSTSRPPRPSASRSRRRCWRGRMRSSSSGQARLRPCRLRPRRSRRGWFAPGISRGAGVARRSPIDDVQPSAQS